MTTTLAAPTAKRAPITGLRKTAFIAGALYLLTFVTSIPTLGLYGPVKKLGFITGTGSDVGVHLRRLHGGDPGTGWSRHRARAVPDRQAAERAARAQFRRLAAVGSVNDRRRRRQSAHGRHPETRLGGGDRCRRRRARHDRQVAGRLPQLDFRARPEPHARRQRTAPRHAALPVALGASGHPAGRAHWGAHPARVGRRDDLRLLGPDLTHRCDRRVPGRFVGVLARRLVGRQRASRPCAITSDMDNR